MKNAKHIVKTVLFCGTLAVFSAVSVFSPKEKGSFYENRRLAVFPVPSVETVLNGTFFSDVETYISDHFACRVPLLRLNVRKELALHLGVAPSQISRILNGDTKSINSDLLIKLAREFHVSTDYILGIHKEPQDTGYLPMLLMSTAFRPGECLNFIQNLKNQDMQKMTYCEYYY